MRVLYEIVLLEADFENENSEWLELATAGYYWFVLAVILHGFSIFS